MGWFSKSSSSSSTQNITEVTTPTAGAQDESLAIAAAGDVHFLDAGVIERAFQFASESLGVVSKTVSSGQAAQEKALGMSLDTTKKAVEESQSGGAQRLLYLGLGFAALFAVVFVVRANA